MHACHRHNYLTGTQFPGGKFQETSYLSDRVCLRGCQECGTKEEMYAAKTCSINGSVKTTVHHWIVALTISVHCNSLKPILTEENKLARVLMAMHFRDLEDPMEYQAMHDQIHLDEKWFFLSWEKEIRLLPDKKNPKHCIKHKSHNTKVMFLCAVARPQFNPSANSWWAGKLGIWPIGDWEPAKLKLKNMEE